MNWFQRSALSVLGLDQYTRHEETGDVFIIDPKTDFGICSTDREKVIKVFSNPAVLKVFKLQCDMFSLGEVYVYNSSLKEKKNDPVINLLKNPNPFQQKSQLLWDYMFWKMIGNAYCYLDSDNAQSSSNKIYFLDPSKINFPDQFRTYKDKLVLSSQMEALINDLSIDYTYDDGTSIKIKWGKISHLPDLTNGGGDWFRGRSVIDSIYEIITNGREAVRSKNINIRYARKYLVAGQADPENTSQLPMSNTEKLSIEQRVNGLKDVHAIKSMIDIKRFVEDAKILSELDQSYWDDYFKVGSLFGIPSEVLEAYNTKGATYENQEKARGAHVDYTLTPAGNQFMNALEKRFGYTDKNIVISWDHLPFTQVFAKDKATTEKIKSDALLNFMKAGVKLEEINATLDTNFTELDYEPAKRANSTGQSGNQENSGQSSAGQN